MSDLYIDGAMLARVRENFRRIESLLSQPGRDMRNLDVHQVGHQELENRMDEFGREWEYGIGQLGEFSGSAVKALDSIADAFEKADADLAQLLNDAMEGDS